jgi:transcription initiation factor TFIIF subunit beta
MDKAQILFNEAQTHGRSYLYEQMKRNAKKQEKRKKWEPYTRKSIPSMSFFRAAVGGCAFC